MNSSTDRQKAAIIGAGPAQASKKNPKSFEDWVSNQFGERLFRIFQNLQRESVGHELQGDFRRMGGAADQGPVGRLYGATAFLTTIEILWWTYVEPCGAGTRRGCIWQAGV